MESGELSDSTVLLDEANVESRKGKVYIGCKMQLSSLFLKKSLFCWNMVDQAWTKMNLAWTKMNLPWTKINLTWNNPLFRFSIQLHWTCITQRARRQIPILYHRCQQYAMKILKVTNFSQAFCHRKWNLAPKISKFGQIWLTSVSERQKNPKNCLASPNSLRKKNLLRDSLKFFISSHFSSTSSHFSSNSSPFFPISSHFLQSHPNLIKCQHRKTSSLTCIGRTMCTPPSAASVTNRAKNSSITWFVITRTPSYTWPVQHPVRWPRCLPKSVQPAWFRT